MLKAAGVFKHVRPFCYHQALKVKIQNLIMTLLNLYIIYKTNEKIKFKNFYIYCFLF